MNFVSINTSPTGLSRPGQIHLYFLDSEVARASLSHLFSAILTTSSSVRGFKADDSQCYTARPDHLSCVLQNLWANCLLDSSSNAHRNVTQHEQNPSSSLNPFNRSWCWQLYHSSCAGPKFWSRDSFSLSLSDLTFNLSRNTVDFTYKIYSRSQQLYSEAFNIKWKFTFTQKPCSWMFTGLFNSYQMSFNGWMDKQITVNPYYGIPVSN